MQIGRHIEDLKRYPSYQDAAGLDGEPIEFERKKFSRIYNIDPSQGDPEGLGKEENRTGSFLCLCSMTLSGKRMMIIAFRTPSRSRIIRTGFYQDMDFSGYRFGKEVFDGQGDLQPTKWYSNSEKLVILFSQLPVL